MGRQIVVVEDDQTILETVRDLLEFEGFSVIGVTHPDQIATAVGTAQPDLFLIDLMLPEMDGIQLAEQLHACGFGNIPMIAMSASHQMVTVARTSRFFREALSKPFDVDELLTALEQHVA